MRVSSGIKQFGIMVALVLSLILSSLHPVYAGEAIFKDLSPQQLDYSYVKFLVDRGIIKGYGDGTFRPGARLSRAEMAALIVRAVGLGDQPASTTPHYKDVTPGFWGYASIEAATAAGLLKGYNDGTFRPDEPVSRAEAAAIILRMTSTPLPDVALPSVVKDVPAGHWAERIAAVAIDSAIMPLATKNGFAPDTPASRAEAARSLAKMINMMPEKACVPLIGTLIPIEGKVTVSENGTSRKISETISCTAGCLISTANKSAAEIRFSDGSGLKLSENTTIAIKTAEGKATILKNGSSGALIDNLEIKLSQGRILGALASTYNNEDDGENNTAAGTGTIAMLNSDYSYILASANNTDALRLVADNVKKPELTWYKEPYKKKVRVKVDMPWGVAAVRGTIWMNEVGQGGQSTSVVNGSVEVSSGTQSVNASAGQGVQQSAGQPPTPPRPLTQAQREIWAQQQNWIAERVNQMLQSIPLVIAPPSVQQQVQQAPVQLTVPPPPQIYTGPPAAGTEQPDTPGNPPATSSPNPAENNQGDLANQIINSIAQVIGTGGTSSPPTSTHNNSGNSNPPPDTSGEDIRASITTATIALGQDVATAQSTKAGTVYLISDNSDISTQTAAEEAVAAGTARKAYIVAANTDTTISTIGLAPGTYKVVAADHSGNLSEKSEGTITIDSFAGGCGTAAEPYIITTAQSLNEVRNNLDAHYKLAADIDMNITPYNTDMGWLPVGNDDMPFNGTFDGAGYSINNIMINQPVGEFEDILDSQSGVLQSRNGAGLFGSAGRDARICNLKIENISANGSDTGGVAGHNNGIIVNCSAAGIINGMNSGGLAGINAGAIRNCRTYAQVESPMFAAGGAAGANIGIITNSHSTGSTNGILSGGLAGYNLGSIDRCYSANDVTVKELPGGDLNYFFIYLFGGNSCGGLVGINYGVISNAYATGSVMGQNTGAAGGLAGFNGNTIIDCYSTGKVAGASMTGGLVGEVAGGSIISSLLGLTNQFSIISSCYDKNTSCQADVGQGVPRASEQMKQQASYKDWDFTWTWQINPGEYPTLQSDTVSIYDFSIADISSIVDIKPDKNSINVRVASDADITRLVPRFSLPAGAVASINGVVQVGGLNCNDFSSPVRYTVTDNNGKSRNWTVTVSAGGIGTIKDPVLIKTAEDLNQIRKHLDWNYQLAANIDLNIAPYNTGAGWQPIGTKFAPFTGSFDGAGYSINNLLVNRPGGDYNGFFGYTGKNARLINVQLVNALIKGNSNTGMLAGSNQGSITNCCSNGSVNGSEYTGGLVGLNEGSISNCYADGSVTGTSYTGGLAGENYHASITYCYASCSVSGTSSIGGLAGFNSSSSNINYSYYDKEISGNSDTGKGEPKTTQEMKAQATYAGWDFTNTWSIAADEYPTLRSSLSICSYSFKGINAQTNIDQQSRAITVELPPGSNLAQLVAEYTLSGRAVAHINGAEQASGVTSNDFSSPVIYTLTTPNGNPIEWTVTVSTLSEGTGTISDPYIIKTAGQLGCIRSYPDSHFKLGADIDLDIAPYNSGLGWQPIQSFKGSLDGAGYTISKLFINQPGKDLLGLFALIESNAKLYNIKLEGIEITGGTYTGGLSGRNYGCIYDCNGSGNISGTGDYTGGMIGINSGLIENCCVSGTITGSSNTRTTGTGGLVGRNYGSINYSYTSGNVNGNSNYAGGLVGYNAYSISQSYSCASVSSSARYGDIGGLVGWNSGSINDSFSSGSVTPRLGGGGGLVGYHTEGTISNCYSCGSVSGLSGSPLSGGLVGDILTKAVVSNSYYDKQTSQQSDTGKGEPKSTADMQKKATYAGWDFINTWSINAGEYPTLHSSASICTYRFKGINGQINIDQQNRVIAVELPPGSNLNQLVAEYILSRGADASINETLQVSGVTSNDFSIPVIYTLTSKNGDSIRWTVIVSILSAGTGTSVDPYIIKTAGELNCIRNHLDSHFKLGADIDLNIAPYNAGTGWQPIGSSDKSFNGSFDGAGYTIHNLFINRPGCDGNGLFGYTSENAALFNVKLENASIDGKLSTGGLVGRNSGCINGCYVSGTVNGGSSTGGLAGYNYGRITASYSSVTVSGTSYDIGGLVGNNYGNINNCYSKGSVSSSSFNSGGLAGNNNGSINNCYASGSVIGNGGLVGYNYNNCVVSNSYYDKEISGQSDTGKGEPKTTAEMKTQATYAGWDFINTWSIQPDSYPTLHTSASILTYSFKGVTGRANIDRQNRAITVEVPPGSNFSQLVAEFTLSGGAVASINEIVQTSGVTSNDFSSPVIYTLTSASGDSETWTVIVSSLSAAIGTSSDPYIIKTAGQLDCIRNHPDSSFKLGADIDLNIFPYNSGTGWQPIGSGDTYFTGSFDGAGYTISNLLINRPEGNYTGLFGSTGINAKLLNVKLENATVNGGRLSGCLVGYNEGSLGNCNASGDISGSSYTGGLIGSNWGNITTCCSTGNVSGSAYNTGGLAGYNYGSISNSYASGSVSSDSYNTGGLAGYNYGSISNSYASGSVSSNSYDTGGLVGENDGSISNSYASGSVSGDSDTGGLVGYNGKSISNCYYDKEKSGQRDTGKGIPKTTLEMQNQSTYVGWDFVSIWSITAGAYPVILTQAGEQLPVISAYSFLGVSGQVAIDQNNRYITVELPRGTSTENLVAVFTLSDGASASVNDIAQISGVTANDFRYPLNYKVVDANGKAAAWNVTVSILAEGTGSADDPYIIKTAGELDCVRNHLESCFKLGADIDLGLGYYGRGSGWLPVGSTDTPFNGVFDGGGYIIRNLFIYRPQDNYTGLFGCLGSKAIIKNVNLEDVMVYGGDYTGALAGDNHGIINTSCVTGSVHGDYWTGGLAGANSRGSISNCYSNAGVIGMQNVGGLAGINRGSIMYCYNSGHVSGEYDGGLVGSDGWSSNNGTIRNSYYDEETAGVCVSVSSQARTTAQMKQEATYLGWDFDSIWSIAANQYPRLKNVSGNDTGFNDYIIINTADELNAVRENLNGYYRLGADIDLGAAPYNTDGGWLPIGDNEHPFTGVLDGTGYSIANLCIDRPDGQYSGLFGVVSSSASLANIKLINVSIDAGEYTGGLAGNNRGLISNSGIGGTIKGSNDYTGGLVAVNDGIINNSFNNAVITGFYYCGGLAGENHGSINNSFSNASIDGSYYCGGLAGRNYGSIDYCYSTGLVSGVSSYAGGLVGTNNEVINYSYYDKETSGRNDTGKGEAKTTVEMKQQATYVGWDFNTIWLIDEGNAYPVFGSFSNAAPQAQAIWIKGIAAPGQVLNGIYSYYDAEGDREGNSSFQWYRETPGDDSRRAAIAGATGRTYTLGDDDAGQNIYFEVIPAAVDGTINGNAVSTDIYIPKLPIQVDQILWLQGDAGTTISEANQLTGWQDQSLCGNDAFDTGSDAWPQVVGNGLNGHAVIRFDGWQNRIVLPALAESLPQATTIMVLKNDSCDDRALLSPFNMSNDTDGSICFMRQGMMYVGGKSDYNLAVPTSSFNDGFNILIITADASEHKNMQVYLNETLQTTLFYDAGIYENEWSIAGSNSSDYDHCFKGDIAEVMVYKGIISEARITDIVAYLKNKYALNLDQLP